MYTLRNRYGRSAFFLTAQTTTPASRRAPSIQTKYPNRPGTFFSTLVALVESPKTQSLQLRGLSATSKASGEPAHYRFSTVLAVRARYRSSTVLAEPVRFRLP